MWLFKREQCVHTEWNVVEQLITDKIHEGNLKTIFAN